MTHTPGPKLCGRCGEPQPETQDWFGEAVRMKAINADLLAALEAAKAVIEDIGEWEIGTKPRSEILHTINVAIAKAEGK